MHNVSCCLAFISFEHIEIVNVVNIDAWIRNHAKFSVVRDVQNKPFAVFIL